MPGLTARDAATDRRGTDGQLLRVVVDAAGRDCGEFHAATVRSVLTAHGVKIPPTEGAYAVERTAAVCEALVDEVGAHTVERFGRRVPAVLDWPRDVSTVGEAVAAFPAAYDGIHDGDAGGFAFDRSTPGRGTLTGETPYPRPLERGVIRGMGDHFGGDDEFLLVGGTTVETGPAVDAGAASDVGTLRGDERVYDLQWPRIRS